MRKVSCRGWLVVFSFFFVCLLAPQSGLLAADEGAVEEVISDSEKESIPDFDKAPVDLPVVGKSNIFYEKFIQDRLDVGLRVSYFEFDNPLKRTFNEDGSFRGGFTAGISLDTIEEDQNYLPVLYLRYWVHRYIGVELGWERLAAGTSTYWDGHSDGDLEASGPTILLIASTDRAKRVYVYAGFGYAQLMADFDDDPWGEGIHNIKVEDTTATIMEFGAVVGLGRNLKLDLTARHLVADIDSHFWLQYGEVRRNDRYWSFPVDNWAAQIGLLYSF